VYPNVCKDELYCLPSFPDVTDTNGLTKAIIEYVKFTGGLSERINVEGRTIKQKDTITASGAVLVGKSVRVKSSATKGSADIAITFRGHSIKVEVKNAATKDRMREKQKEYRDRTHSAGGTYFVATEINQFLDWWDNIVRNAPEAKLF